MKKRPARWAVAALAVQLSCYASGVAQSRGDASVLVAFERVARELVVFGPGQFIHGFRPDSYLPDGLHVASEADVTFRFGSTHARDVRGGFGECRPYGILHFGRLSQRLRAGLTNCAPPELYLGVSPRLRIGLPRARVQRYR